MTTPPNGAPGSLVLDAEALYRELLRGVRSLMGPQTRLAGICQSQCRKRARPCSQGSMPSVSLAGLGEPPSGALHGAPWRPSAAHASCRA